MNITRMMAVAALFSTSMQAEQRVTVFVEAGAVVPGQTLSRAEGLATDMFARAGVRINWRIGRPKREAITVGVSNVTPSSYYPGSLAFALPYEGVHITVFYDRISKTYAPDLAPTLLAHVLVPSRLNLIKARCSGPQ